MLPGVVVQVIQLLKIILECNDVPPQSVVVAHKVNQQRVLDPVLCAISHPLLVGERRLDSVGHDDHLLQVPIGVAKEVELWVHPDNDVLDCANVSVVDHVRVLIPYLKIVVRTLVQVVLLSRSAVTY